MIDISECIRKNRNEAREIIKSHGGRIDFVNDIEESGSWDGCITSENVPWVVVGYDEGLIDTAVLAVRNTEGACIEFLAYDVEAGETYGWVSDAECCSNSENEIYMHIGELAKQA